MGGDFNLIRSKDDINTGHINPRLVELFNGFIDLNHLIELKRKGGRFTWTNK